MDNQKFKNFQASWASGKDLAQKVLNGQATECAKILVMEAGILLAPFKFKPGRVIKFEYTMGCLSLMVFATEGAKKETLYVDSALTVRKTLLHKVRYMMGGPAQRRSLPRQSYTKFVSTLVDIMSAVVALDNNSDRVVLHALDGKRIPLYEQDTVRTELETIKLKHRVQRLFL